MKASRNQPKESFNCTRNSLRRISDEDQESLVSPTTFRSINHMREGFRSKTFWIDYLLTFKFI